MATDVVSLTGVLPPELHPCIDHLVTDDGAPVDGIRSEKQMRLLTESIWSSWPGPADGQPFVVLANVGLFFEVGKPPLVPDVMLSLGVELIKDFRLKEAQSYFAWVYGKMPDVVVEIVSNREGGENSTKLAASARIGIPYYLIFDPELHLSDEPLQAYRLVDRKYQRLNEPIWLPGVELGVRLWHGTFDKLEETWLRWVDANGDIIPTGYERAEAEAQSAQTERERAELERARADAQSARAERLAEKLRQLGIEPNGQ
jgi:hypothetical protein